MNVACKRWAINVKLSLNRTKFGRKKLHQRHRVYSPQILSGASSSRRIGWLKNISRDFRHSPLISASVSCTFFPGLEPRTERQEIFQNRTNFRFEYRTNLNRGNQPSKSRAIMLSTLSFSPSAITYKVSSTFNLTNITRTISSESGWKVRWLKILLAS